MAADQIGEPVRSALRRCLIAHQLLNHWELLAPWGFSIVLSGFAGSRPARRFSTCLHADDR